MIAMTWDELCETCDNERYELLTAIMTDQKRWGSWRLDRKTLELVHTNGYRVDLERCERATDLADWLFHLAAKGWCTPEDNGFIVHALNDTFQLFGWYFETLNAKERWSKVVKEYEEMRAKHTPLTP